MCLRGLGGVASGRSHGGVASGGVVTGAVAPVIPDHSGIKVGIMGDACFTSLCFILSFYATVEHLSGSAAPGPPPQLTCNVTKNPDGSVTYRLDPSPTVTANSSYNWANVRGEVFAGDGNFSADVLKLTEDSVTLKLCLGEMIYRNDGKTQQQGRCHVNCSGDARTPPSAGHRFCLSDGWCPLDWGFVLLVLAAAAAALGYWCARHRGGTVEEPVKTQLLVRGHQIAA